MKRVAIITLTWNKLEQATKLYLDSLYKYTDENLFDLILVDNGSTDGTVEYLSKFASEHSNINVIYNSENLGYSKGNNIGIKSILDKDYEFVALLNNDILFTPDWLEKTIDIFNKDPQLGMVSPRIQKKKDITRENYLSKYQHFLNKYKTHSGDLSYSLEPLFCCVVIKKCVVEKIGLMDENFSPAFWEDNDYCFRAMYAGYSLARSNVSFVFHNHSTSSKSLPSEIFKNNREYFFKKHPLGRWIWAHKRTNVIKDIRRYIRESFE